VLNKVILIGRLTRDPELKYTPNGTAVATFTLAVNRKFNKDETDFIDIVVWRGLAENCANFLGKGRLVAIDGRLQVRTYETQEGAKRKVAEVVADDVRFLDKPAGSSAAEGYQSSAKMDDWEELGKEIKLEDIDIVDKDLDEELPF